MSGYRSTTRWGQYNLPEIGDNEPHKTMRQRLDEHQADISCATCHASMDPLGLGLEHFNGVGQYREIDKGLTMDTTGVLFGQSFDGPKSLERDFTRQRRNSLVPGSASFSTPRWAQRSRR